MSTLVEKISSMSSYAEAQFTQRYSAKLDSKKKTFSGVISGKLTDGVFLHFKILSRVGFRGGKLKFSIEYDNIEDVIIGPNVTYKNSKIIKTKGREFKLLAAKGSLGLELSTNFSKQTEYQEIELSDFSDPDFGLVSCKAEVKKNKNSVTKFEVEFFVKLKESPGKDQLIFSYTVDCGSRHKYLSKIPILIEGDEVKPKCQATIAGILGHPKAGKSSFVNVLNKIFDKTSNTVGVSSVVPTRTANYLKYQNAGDKYDNARPFELCDTSGKLFQVDNEDHVEMLKLFLNGVKDGTPLLSNKLDPQKVSDPTKKITAAIIISSARWLLSTDRPKWFFGIGSRRTKTLEERIFPLCGLINYLRGMLQPRKVVVVITHCDMVEPEDKELILEGLSRGVPSDGIDGIERNFVVFGEKECSWKEKDLLDFDNKLKAKSVDFMRNMSQYDLDQAMEETLKKDRLTFHIDESLCQNQKHKRSHKHPFTQLTKTEYLRALSILGVDLDPRLEEKIKESQRDSS